MIFISNLPYKEAIVEFSSVDIDNTTKYEQNVTQFILQIYLRINH